ncbi:SusD family protein [Tangfeifania diversioriginum]|uniref:SusD family protein n=1 Tax=Tangfeifania diversioriginum TaxID=1168035 RepID=A0A1M6FUV3_9BACT|nr:RagB/SusD family nutrient uptake outer membrane protein [Tangfeifania diversioriginum]SHJ01511.1 SusD family protein [Tangfeifania diversioriginum]
MNNHIKSFLLLTVISFLLTACSEDFLDREPSGPITAEQLQEASKTNPDISKAMVSGIYSLTFAQGTGGTTGHDDYGQKSIDIATDLMSGDMTLGGKTYTWFSGVYELKDQKMTDLRPSMNWRYYFTIIKAANEVIDGLGGSDAMPEDPTNRAYFGQAKTLRAYAYFYLDNLYQHTYDGNQNKPCVPVYETQLTTEAQPLATVEQVYSLVIKDLEDAVEALEGYERTNKVEINKYVAQGYLAYAYLTTGNYAGAVEAANDVVTNGGFTLMSAGEVIESGFRNVAIPGWIWGVDLTTDNTYALASFWGHMDIFTFSYAGVGDYKGIDRNLWEQIPETDVRKGQFVNMFNDGGLLPVWKFYHEARTPLSDRTWTNDLLYMRVAEMYLIKAEALARDGKDPEGALALWELVKERNPAAENRIKSLRGEDLLNEIYFQTRIELWGEGKSYLAMKRFKATNVRGPNHMDLAGEVIAHDDPRMRFEVPEDEVNNNPFISIGEIAAIPEKSGSATSFSKK